MRTKQRHLKKSMTWGLMILEGLSFFILLFVLSIDYSASKVTSAFQFKYFLIVLALMLITYGCHKLLSNYGNRNVLNKLLEEEGN